MDDWLFLVEVGDGVGLGSLELRSATPFTTSAPSTPSCTDMTSSFEDIDHPRSMFQLAIPQNAVLLEGSPGLTPVRSER